MVVRRKKEASNKVSILEISLMLKVKAGKREDSNKEVVKEAILTLEVSSKKPSRAEVEASGNQVHLETNKITTKYLK